MATINCALRWNRLTLAFNLARCSVVPYSAVFAGKRDGHLFILVWLLDIYYAYAFEGVRPIGVVSH